MAGTAVALGIVLILFVTFFVAVERRYTKRIDERLAGHRWDLSSKLYAEPFSLRAGLPLAPEKLLEKLDGLGYRRVEKISGVEGEYAVGKNFVDLCPHAVPALGLDKPPGPIRVAFNRGRVLDMKQIRSGSSLYSLVLEPELITEYYSSAREAREVVTLSRIPKNLISAILAAEDQRFYEHPGFDLWAMMRALVMDVFTSRLQGGSTLTQQLVKNYFLTPERTLKRKLQELLMAWCLERRATKQEIMEMYVNEIYLGQRGTISINGFASAARLYFRKSVSDLTLEECALLAGIIRGPNVCTPYRYPEKALERRNWVLGRMVEEKLVTAEEAKAAATRPVRVEPMTKEVNQAPYFADWVRVSISEHFDDKALKSSNLAILTTIDPSLQELAQQVLRASLDRLQQTYAKRFGKRRLDGCLIAADPRTGEIRAMVGGRDYSQSQFNRASDARRQIGSVFKPVVLAAALYANADPPLTAATIVVDEPTTFEFHGQQWSPADFEQPKGPVMVQRAIAESLNIPTAKIAMETGLNRVVQIAHRLGFRSQIPAFPAISLGGFETTPLEVAEAFSTIANGGMHTTLHGVREIRGEQGQVLWRPDVKQTRALPGDIDYIVISVMKSVVDEGTAAGVRSRGFYRPAAGKTGTTNDMRDCWFVGFVPQLLAVVWVGFDDNSPTGLTGALAAAPIWADFMTKALAATPEEDFFIPEDIVFRAIDPINGYLASGQCDPIEVLPFIEGTEPTETCGQHPG